MTFQFYDACWDPKESDRVERWGPGLVFFTIDGLTEHLTWEFLSFLVSHQTVHSPTCDNIGKSVGYGDAHNAAVLNRLSNNSTHFSGARTTRVEFLDDPQEEHLNEIVLTDEQKGFDLWVGEQIFPLLN